MAESYAPHPRSKVNRLAKRAAYDRATVHGILNSAQVLHVSFVPTGDDPFPTILPMLGAIGSYADSDSGSDDTPVLYLHGSSAARLMRLTDPQHNADAGAEGVPLAVEATLVDGIVLALTPMHHSMNYRSAVLHGWGRVVADEGERNYAMTLITDNILPGRWDASRVPPTKAELTATAILRVDIVSASAKVRTGSTAEDRKDLKSDDVLNSVWSGVVPCWTQRGKPVPTAHNRIPLPAYIAGWIDRENAEGAEKAQAAIEAGNN